MSLILSCHECGVTSAVNSLQAGEQARCPRCGFHLVGIDKAPIEGPVSYAIASLIALLASISYPFMSFSVQGISQEITLIQSAEVLSQLGDSALGFLLLASVILLPALYLLCLIYLFSSIAYSDSWLTHRPLQKQLLKVLSKIKPWLMVDVFLIGVLVSLVKIASLADVAMGVSFWAFAIYAVLVVKTISIADLSWVWQQLFPLQLVEESVVGTEFQQQHHLACHVCGLVHPYDKSTQHCQRCHSHLHQFEPQQNLQVVWALLIASIIFYIPANLYPMMYTSAFGHSEGSTIMGGVILLWNMGSYPIAMVIFFASIFIPMAKMFALAYLYWNAKRVNQVDAVQSRHFLKVYRITEFIGRWSMIDIFVVAILVALVQLDGLMAIYPGPAAASFAVVVIFTMLSAMFFDSRMMWR